MSIVRNGSLGVAITLALGVSHAQATTFNVTNTSDSGPGSLRQALLDAATDTNTPHTISLAAIAGQTVTVQDRLVFATSVSNMDLTIEGSDVTVASDGSDGVLAIVDEYYYGIDLVVEIKDMTITGGVTDGGGLPEGAERGLIGAASGGGVFFSGSSYGDSELRLESVTVSGNEAGLDGGGVAVFGGRLVINNSTISDNEARTGGGIFHEGSSLEVSNSLITDNRAESDAPIFQSEERLFARRSETRGFSGFGGNGGGIISLSSDGASISDSTISGNSADGSFGGADIVSEFGDVSLTRSTVSGNTSGGFGGGVFLASYDGSVTVRGSTISGNVSEGPVGGVAAATYAGGSVLIENSTISDNATTGFDIGGLVAVRFDYGGRIGNGSIEVNFSTIVDNTSVGGTAGANLLSDPYYIDRLGPINDPVVNGSIISGNLASGVASDLDADPGLVALGEEDDASNDRGMPVNIDVNLSLLGSSTPQLTLDSVSQNLLGEDPLLGPLADNGGPTLSHLPGVGSPVIGVVPLGQLGCGSTIDEDQTGESRPDGDSCTLGSVEFRGAPPPVAAPVAVPVGHPLGMLLMAGLLGLAGLFGLRRRRRT